MIGIVREHSGACGMEVDDAGTMVHKAGERVSLGRRLEPVSGSASRAAE